MRPSELFVVLACGRFRPLLLPCLAAVRGGLLSLEEACSRYTLSVDEFLNWQAAIDKHGLAGLRTTWIQHYREG